MARVLAAAALILLCCAACTRTEQAPEEERGGKGTWGEAEIKQHLARVRESPELGYDWTYLEVASCLDLLGDANRPWERAADSKRAESFRQRALAIREDIFGKNHIEAYPSLHKFAFMEEDSRRREARKYSELAQHLARARELRELIQAWTPLETASCLNMIGEAYRLQGPRSSYEHKRAEPLLRRALAIREQVLGSGHLDVATSLHNLANLYADEGQYEQARLLYTRALAAWEGGMIEGGLFGRNPADIAKLLHSLARVQEGERRYAQARLLYERALAIREEALGKYDPDVAASLDSLGSLLAAQGHYTQAEPMLDRALAIREKMFDIRPSEVASSLHSLANLYASQGQYARAEPLYKRALGIREAALGRTHPEVVHSLHSLARLHIAQRDLDGALPLIERAFAPSRENLPQVGLSETRLASSLSLLQKEEEYLYSLAGAYPDNARVRHLALSAALFWKGRSVREVADLAQQIYRTQGPANREDFERLRALRTEFAMLSLGGPGSLSVLAREERLEEITNQITALESSFTFARGAATLKGPLVLPQPSATLPIDSVTAAIPDGGALVEFIVHDHRPLVPRTGAAAAKSQAGLRYLALLLFPDGITRAVDLGPAERIDRAVQRLYEALNGSTAAYQHDAQVLYNLTFRPLVPLLGSQVKRLFVAPDGQLALIPFAALHDGRRFLVDAWDITYLLSGRELIPRPQDVPVTFDQKGIHVSLLQGPGGLSPHGEGNDRTSAPGRALSVVVLADPDFSSPPATPSLAAQATPTQDERSDSLKRFFSTLRSELGDRPWPPLPGTRKEAQTIQRLFPDAQLLLGGAATKDALLELPTPGILHIATHGFFLENASAPVDSRAVVHFGAVGERGPRQGSSDPLLRSGLVLAGAHAPAADNGTPPLEESLVTALELAGLDLGGTQLVVLSACDTGRGDAKRGQGVYGLRSALMMAGAETLVTSLWQVNDEATQELMEAYYRRLLAGQGRASALRQAMLVLRHKYPHPHFWAPFIAIGQDTPLQGLAPR